MKSYKILLVHNSDLYKNISEVCPYFETTSIGTE